MKKILISLAFILILFSCKYKEIEKNKEFTIGVITSYSKHYRSNAFTPNYTYKVNGIEYSGGHYKDFNMNYWSSYENKVFPVVYSTKNPQKSIILITPHDFERWGLEFPDSLDWVKSKMDW